MYKFTVVIGLDGIGDSYPADFQVSHQSFEIAHPVIDHEFLCGRGEVAGGFLERTPLGKSFFRGIGALVPFEYGTIVIDIEAEI